jgi:hypothetical protein
MIPMQDFLNSPTSIYEKSWKVRPWWLVSWGLKQLGLTGRAFSGDRLQIGEYVILHNLEVISKLPKEEN